MKQRPIFSMSGANALMLSLAMIGAGTAGATPSIAKADAGPKAVFAEVADTVITFDEYNTAFNAAVRSKFFHGKATENEVAGLQREVADQVVTRVLLLREAKERGLQPDRAEIQKTLDAYEQRYAKSEQWKKTRDQVLPGLTAHFEEKSILEQLEKSVRTLEAPDENALRGYYMRNQDKFTEPEQLRVSAILLKVDPGATVEMWEKAVKEAEGIAAKVGTAEAFAEMARKISDDPTGKEGGDMGYVHTGMLPDDAQAALAKIQPGELTPPVQLLQGIVLFRLTERKVPKLADFDKVKVRAEQLYRREQSELAWKNFIANLKNKTPARIDQSRFLPLSEKSGKDAVTK